jgi:prevent-host-death family protein
VAEGSIDPLIRLDESYEKDYNSHKRAGEEDTMESAAISEFKAHMSEYIGRVKAGEEIVVTERGKPVARVIPVRPYEHGENQMLQMEREGILLMGKGKLDDTFWSLNKPEDPEGLVLKALLEEREEER